MNCHIKRLIFLVITLFLSSLFILKIPTIPVLATNVLTNPSFTGGSTGWTLSTAIYDSAIYQDSAGSVANKTTVGRNLTSTGTVTQTISTTIIGGSTVYLNFYWAKQCVSVNCTNNQIDINIISGTSNTVWTDTTIPSAGSMTAWQQVSNNNISSYFTTTGTYQIQISMYGRNGNDKAAQALAWVDNMNLDVTPPNVTVGTTGTQISQVEEGTNNAYLGGAFTFVRNGTSTSVTSITISETGTISDSNISGLILYYKQEATCSTSIPGDATVFNSTPGTFSSGSSTVTGSMTVGTSQICMYVEADIGAAGIGATIEIQITNPSTQVSASEGTVSPGSAVAISGTTTVIAGGTLSIDIVDGTDTPVTNPSISMSSTSVDFQYQTSTGTLGTSTEKVYITSDSTTTWQVAIAATGGATALWSNSGSTRFYDFNDSTASAEDGADSDSYGGQLTINPSVGTLTPGAGCSNTGISLGSSAGFNEGVVNSVTLLSASSADSSCDWYLTGVSLSQTIPREQSADSYSINFTLTIAAI